MQKFVTLSLSIVYYFFNFYQNNIKIDDLFLNWSSNNFICPSKLT